MIITVEIKKNWYIVYARCGSEKKVAGLLEKKGMDPPVSQRQDRSVTH